MTGSNGKIGEAVLSDPGEHGCGTVNLARGKRREEVSDEYRTTDLLDPGAVYGSLAAGDADAVVHVGTIPSPVNHPGHVTFESNAVSSYHVLEAATAIGLEAAVLPSSIDVVGADFQAAPTHVEYLPVDEAPPDPPGPLRAGQARHRGDRRRLRPPSRHAAGRLPAVPLGPAAEEVRTNYAGADRTLDAIRAAGAPGRDALFSYLHVEDAAARRAVEADLDGHEAFWTVAGPRTPTPTRTPSPRRSSPTRSSGASSMSTRSSGASSTSTRRSSPSTRPASSSTGSRADSSVTADRTTRSQPANQPDAVAGVRASMRPRVVSTAVTDLLAPFDEGVVAAVANERGLPPGTVRELLERHQALLRGFDHMGVDELVYEWRTRLFEDPLVAREGGAYYLAPPGHVWRDLAGRLELDDEATAALRAAHARQFAADRHGVPDGAMVVAED